MFRRFCKRLLTPPLVVLAALFMFCEEWLWDRMVAVTAWLGKLPLVQRMEVQLKTWPPYAALIVMVGPGLFLVPVKLAALYFMAHGHVLAGISVIVLAKVIGTAVVARIFTICKPALMTIGWLNRLTDWLVRVKTALYTKIKAWPAWQKAAAVMARLRHFWKRDHGEGFGRRWGAIKRWLKRKFRPSAVPATPPSKVL